jgi:hypothetical protein
MIVRVPDIPTEGLSVTDASVLGAVYRDPAWRLLDVNLRLERDGADVFVTGEVHAAVSQACGRCLEPSPAEVTATLDVRLVPRPSTADNVELAADDLDVDFYDKDEIDIGALIDAETTLALATVPRRLSWALSGLRREPECGQVRVPRAPAGSTAGSPQRPGLAAFPLGESDASAETTPLQDART